MTRTGAYGRKTSVTLGTPRRLPGEARTKWGVGAGEVSKEAAGKQLTFPRPSPLADVSSPLWRSHTGSERLSDFLQITQPISGRKDSRSSIAVPQRGLRAARAAQLLSHLRLPVSVVSPALEGQLRESRNLALLLLSPRSLEHCACPETSLLRCCKCTDP